MVARHHGLGASDGPMLTPDNEMRALLIGNKGHTGVCKVRMANRPARPAQERMGADKLNQKHTRYFVATLRIGSTGRGPDPTNQSDSDGDLAMERSGHAVGFVASIAFSPSNFNFPQSSSGNIGRVDFGARYTDAKIRGLAIRG